ncbi:hypothetical protein Hanom_Chr12g01171821 [Helianthus anomalus]
MNSTFQIRFFVLVLVFFFLVDNIFFKQIRNFVLSKLPFWSLRFGQFCHISPNLKPFASGSLWFRFYCHFGPNLKSGQISKKPGFCLFPHGHFGHYEFYYILLLCREDK